MTALEFCQAELAGAKAPDPGWIEQDLTPATAIYYGFEVAKVLLTIATAAAASLEEDPNQDQPVMTEVLNGAAFALAGYIHALVALEVLPKSAEEAMASGKIATKAG